MEFLLSIIQIPFLIYFIRYLHKQHSDSLHQSLYYYLLSFKVTCGLCLGVIYYRYYQGGDTVEYGNHLEILSRVCYTDFKSYFNAIVFNELPPEIEKKLVLITHPRAFFFVKLLSPFYILSGSNYWILSVYLSVFSFSGMWILSNTLIKLFKLNSLAVLISFFLFPSIVFWGAGVLKESLSMGIMCYCISILLNIVYKEAPFISVKLIFCMLFLFVLLQLKFYYFAALLSILIPYCLVKLLSYRIELIRADKRLRVGVLVVLIIMLGFVFSLSHPFLAINHIAQNLYMNYTSTHRVALENNVFYFQGLNSELRSFIPHIPRALVYGLFGPFLWHCKKIISLFAGLENTLILILFVVFVMTNSRKEKLRKIDIEEVSVFLYVSILAIFMAFASPSWGTLVRYKIGYLPFFLILILNNNPFIHQLGAKFNFLKPSDKKE